METHGEYHIGKVLAAVRRLHNAWGGSRIQANFKLIGSRGLESVHKIAIIEAYLKPVAAALAGADVLGLADGRGAGAVYGAVAKIMRIGLLFFSLTISATRSMVDIISLRSTSISMRKLSGMDLR